MTKEDHARHWEEIAALINVNNLIGVHAAIDSYISSIEDSYRIGRLLNCEISAADFYEIIHGNAEFLAWDLIELNIPFSIMQKNNDCIGSIFNYLYTHLEI